MGFFSVHNIWCSLDPKGINKHDQLDSNNPRAPEHLKTQEMCDEAVRIESLSLAYVPDHFKNTRNVQWGSVQQVMHDVVYPWPFLEQEMCNEIMRTMPNAFYCIPDDFKRQKMCIKAIEVDPSFF